MRWRRWVHHKRTDPDAADALDQAQRQLRMTRSVTRAMPHLATALSELSPEELAERIRRAITKE